MVKLFLYYLCKNTNNMKSGIKNSNISIQIYDGIEVIAKNETYTDINSAKESAKRIIDSQKNIDPSTTAYAIVWDHKKMVGYFD